MKTFIKNTIRKNGFIYRIAKNIYDYKFWHPKEWKNDILNDYANFKGNVNFIQVGSSNGISADPITNFITRKNWHGVLVEPVPYIFEELKKNYKSIRSRLRFENSAIAKENGTQKFYRLQKSNKAELPFWYEQLGSFNKEVVIKHRDAIPGFDELFIEDTVNAITFKDLVAKHKAENTTFIQIDTEGYDYEVLKMIPFSKMKIDFVMFENRHLSNRDYRSALQLLKDHGFVLGNKYKDTIGVSKEILPFLISTDRMEETDFTTSKGKIRISAESPRTLHQ